ncbi:MAG: family 10 glycosylhydrolase [Symbiopectobacterium sp.]|uniref:family 10 glycosylhydrolase n=1 Tax=Symbiopectobacterium sp. TaxID=2952789 RepID=UPI003F374DEC
MQKQLRATWVSSVINLDWPSKSTLSITNDEEKINAQKNELILILDEIKKMNMNTIMLQIKPCADALYRSEILPWSKYLDRGIRKKSWF